MVVEPSVSTQPCGPFGPAFGLAVKTNAMVPAANVMVNVTASATQALNGDGHLMNGQAPSTNGDHSPVAADSTPRLPKPENNLSERIQKLTRQEAHLSRQLNSHRAQLRLAKKDHLDEKYEAAVRESAVIHDMFANPRGPESTESNWASS